METALDPTIALVTLDGQVFDATKVRALELYALLFAFFFHFLVIIFFHCMVNPAICFPPDGCRNNGHCVSPGICSCARGWSGAKCQNGTIEYNSRACMH